MPIYIASMNMRGAWAPRPEGTIPLNVTSAQGKASIHRRDFSPMSEIPGRYKGFYCFENYWQSGKVFEGMSKEDITKHQSWWRTLNEGKRKYPKAKCLRVLYSNYDGVQRDYIQSRKEIYVKEYRALIQNTESLKKWREAYTSGASIVVYDFDGPRAEDGTPLCVELTKELLEDKLNYTKQPFGHGYIVAAEIAGIKFH